MRLSFNDEESFNEAAGSLNFNNPSSDPDSLLGLGSSSSMPAEERNEDHDIDNSPSDQNIILEVRRVPVGSSSGTYSTPPQEGSKDT